jgi:hypothetical protein
MVVGCIKAADYKTLSSIPAQDTTYFKQKWRYLTQRYGLLARYEMKHLLFKTKSAGLPIIW